MVSQISNEINPLGAPLEMESVDNNPVRAGAPLFSDGGQFLHAAKGSNPRCRYQPEAAHLTRAELYQLVWSEPVSKIAPRFGISDVGLSKLCRRVDVPLPPAGYWMKLKFGKRVPKPPLKAAANSESETVLITERDKDTSEIPDDIAGAIAYEQGGESAIVVPASTTLWHPIVEKWFEDDRQPRQFGYTITPRVRIDALERRRRILVSVFFRALEKRRWSVTSKDRRHVTVTMLGETLEFTIEERMRQVRVPLTPEERRYTTYRDDKLITETTGELRIRLRQHNGLNNRDWIDKPDAPVEARLRDVIIGMIKEAHRSRIRAEELAALHRKWELERQARDEAEERRRREKEQVNALLSASDRWIKAGQLREYVEYALKAGAVGSGDREETSEWASWALSVADHLDPTIKSH